MNNKLLIIAVTLMFISPKVMAGDGLVHSINISVAPVGHTHMKISQDKEEYYYSYKSYLGATLSFEKQLGSTTFMSEFFCQKAKFDYYNLKGHTDIFNPAQEEDIFSAGVNLFIGTTINKYHRFQIPLYIGPSMEYVKGGPLHNLVINLALKGRLKFYITDNIGIFAGISGRFGLGLKSGESKNNGYTIHATTTYAEGGLVIGY